jgi:hypothetical protein
MERHLKVLTSSFLALFPPVPPRCYEIGLTFFRLAELKQKNKLKTKTNLAAKSKTAEVEEAIGLLDFLKETDSSSEATNVNAAENSRVIEDKNDVVPEDLSERLSARANQHSRLSQNTISSIISSAHSQDVDNGKGEYLAKNKTIERVKGTADDINTQKEKGKSARYSPGLLNRELRATISQQQTEHHLAKGLEKKLGADQNKHKRFSSLGNIIHRGSDKAPQPQRPQPPTATRDITLPATRDTNSIGNLISHFSDDSSIIALQRKKSYRFKKTIHAVLHPSEVNNNNNTNSPQTAAALLPPQRPTSTLLHRAPTTNAHANTLFRAPPPSKAQLPPRASVAMSSDSKNSTNDSKKSFFAKTFGREKVADKPELGEKKDVSFANYKDKEREMEQPRAPASAAFSLTPLSSLIHQSYKDINVLREAHGRVVDGHDGNRQQIDFNKIEDSLRAFEE